jgi:spore cortex formation protein SpoVR/YcgB (stage V sporulation)
VIRDMRLFGLFDRADAGAYKVASIHNEGGYRGVRQALARQYDVGIADPNIQVTGADLKGNRTLYLKHFMHRNVPLHEKTRDQVLAHVERLWGHDVKLDAVPSE